MKKNIPIGLIIISHGNLARELRATLEHVVGAQLHIKTISIGTDDDMEQRRSDILKAVGEVDQGAGVIVLTDMFGGTPSNLAISVMDKAKVEIIAGVNLPMLVKLAEIRGHGTLKATALQAREAGREYIHIASQLLGEKNRKK